MTTPPRENLTREEARERARLLHVLAYDVQLDLTGGDERFTTVTTVTFEAEPGAETFIDCTSASVTRAVLNGRELDASAVQPTRIVLTDLAAENTLRIEAAMRYQHEGKGLHHFRDPSDGHVYLHSQFEPYDAHLVYPCFDQPDLKATFALTVDAPSGWVVVSNMAATSEPDRATGGRWAFAPTPRVPTYITAVVAGPYEVVRDRHGDIDLGIYVRASLAEVLDADEIFSITKQGFDWFNANFGIPYAFGKYDQLFVPEFSAGAMENPGCVTFSESYIFRSKVTDSARERRAETILHEMAHMWFGDLVTMRWWDDLWLNESFATFCSVLCQALATRFTDSWVTFLDAEKAWAKVQDQLPSTHPIAADMLDVETVHQNFDGITYAKGASVLRQLVAWVGQDAFLAGCREYFKRHQFANAELADFLAALEEASGRDLSTWTDLWLATTGVNTLGVEAVMDDAGTLANVAIVQTAAPDHPTLRPHRTTVGVYDWDGDRLVRTARVELDVDGTRTEVPALNGTPAGALLLVNDDDLTYTKVRVDERSMAALTKHLHSLADPLARALAWSATWDMVRDGELPASQFVELAINNVRSDGQIGVLQRLLSRAEGAALRYADPSRRESLLAALRGHAAAEMRAAAPGSDEQLAWVRHWASCATSAADLDEMRGMLAGTWALDGLAVDEEMRWHLVFALAKSDAGAEALIDAELARDQTDLGERHAAAARAALPTAAAKAAAWQALTADASLSHTMSREVWGGFQRLDQPDLIAPYVDAYLEALPQVWAARSTEWAIEFAGGMFPHACASDDLLAKVDAVLASGDLARPLQRAVVEERDGLVRTLRARACDRDGAGLA